MDHRGLRERFTGAGCAACGAAIASDRVAVLADRGDVAYVELSCGVCASLTLCIVLDTGPADEGPTARMEPPPLTEADVTAMRRFLAGWEGDLRSLLRRPDSTGTGSLR